jgi:hypothetical protein
MRRVEILRRDWDRLRRSYPRTAERELLAEVVARGRELLDEEIRDSIASEAPLGERLAWLRRWTPRRAASVATLGFELVRNRNRLAEASRLEVFTTQRYLDLNREVIPGLKERAALLRDEIHDLEEKLRARGRDPDEIRPQVPARIEVDDYQPVQFQEEQQKKKTLDFFRRIGGDR